jgi:hypothetical protein
MEKKATVLIHGSEWKLVDIEYEISQCRRSVWTRRRWARRDALIQKSGTASLYNGQNYDPTKYKLVQGGWTHDHCQICWWELFETATEEHSVGYTNGLQWICSECYEKIIATKS